MPAGAHCRDGPRGPAPGRVPGVRPRGRVPDRRLGGPARREADEVKRGLRELAASATSSSTVGADRDGPPLRRDPAGLRRDGPRHAVVGRLRVGLLRPAAPAARGVPGAGGHPMPGLPAPLAWNIAIDTPPEGDQVAHFLVPAAHIWDDVVHTCGHQRLFCSPTCVDTWLQDQTTSAATSWTSRRCGGWPKGGTPAGWTTDMCAAIPARPPTTSAASG